MTQTIPIEGNRMRRRDFIAGSTVVGFLNGYPRLASAVALDHAASLEQATAEAWLYGLMLIENAQARATTLAQSPANTLIHADRLTTPKTQSVTTPNNDTLYSRAWIDLAHGPAILTMPNVGDRYVSYAFMDMYGNNFAILGSRTTGGSGGTVKLVGPNAPNNDPLAIRSPTRWVWLLIRLLIDGEEDLTAANALQKQMRLVAAKADAPPKTAKRSDHWPEYFSSVQSLLNENPPPVTDQAFFKRIAALGLALPGSTSRNGSNAQGFNAQGFNVQRFSSGERTAIESGLALARKQLLGTRSGRVTNGWAYPKSSLGNYGQDYLYRAQVALSGLAALTPNEAMYMRPVAADRSNFLSGATPWRLHFDKAQLPPVDGFWSLTMYQLTPDGQQFFFDNVINRYAIGDRTAGLKYGTDGSLDIWISRDDPGAERRSNWLPAPPTDKLAMVFRAYMPKSELLDGTYALPAVTAA
jgi:hypothetical protein